MDGNGTIEERIREINRRIGRYLPEETGYQKKVLEAMNYSIRAGGKRLRPMLLLETYRLFGGSDEEETDPFLAAIEMIHTYSLIHDDLPAMDDDDYRRGHKTTHVVYGEAMGILAGDGLLNLAFETALTCLDRPENLSGKRKALKLLAEKPGIRGMLGGQAIDVENSDRPMDAEKLETVYRLKTCALIEAAMMIGAALAGASGEELAVVEKAARRIGMAFQIRDDILDVSGNPDILGKPLYSDEKNRKTTYVTLFGLPESEHRAESCSKEAIELLQSLPGRNLFLEKLIRRLISRDK